MDRFKDLLEMHANKTLPPVQLWQPKHVGRIDIQIDASGNWFHEGDKITRQALVNLFSTILRKEGDNFYLVTPVEKLQISVADAPFIAIDMEVRNAGPLMDLLFTTNVGDIVLIDKAHPLYMHNQAPYIEVRDGLAAKLSRSVFYRLVEIGVESNDTLIVYSQGVDFSLGSTV